jgi:hypothetical protein
MTHCNIDFENIKRYWTSFGSLRKNGKNIILFIFHVFLRPTFFGNDSSNALISSNSILWIAFEMGKIFEFSAYPSSFRFAHDLAYYWSYEDDFGFVGFVSFS